MRVLDRRVVCVCVPCINEYETKIRMNVPKDGDAERVFCQST